MTISLLALAACGGSSSTPLTGPTITVLSPSGGETWQLLIPEPYGMPRPADPEGTAQTVTWTSTNYTGDVDLEYSTDGGDTWTALASNTPDDGSEEVTAPVAPTHQARIRVSAANGDPSVALTPWGISEANFQIAAPPTDILAGLPGVELGSLGWGDYDNDGDLDLALSGWGGDDGRLSRIYRNDGGAFTDIGAGLPGASNCSLAWGDYDNDGDADLALAGATDNNGRLSRIYQNDGGAFTDLGAGLPGVSDCSLAWGDYDNDGDLDLALAGAGDNGRLSRIYRNDGGAFTDVGAGLPGVSDCSLAWGDYDNDGDLDLALAGGGDNGRLSRIYRNDGGVFTDRGAGLPGVTGCSLAWGDYDNDGDVDLAMLGDGDSGELSRIYRNDGGSFTHLMEPLEGLGDGSLAWGDYDNDGDLDLAMTGDTRSRIYYNPVAP